VFRIFEKRNLMNPFWSQIIYQIIQKENKKDSNRPESISRYAFAKKYRELKINLIRLIKDFLFISIGIFLAAFGFKGFLLTNQFIDGGATGISLLFSAVTKLPLYYFVIGVNIPFVFLAYKVMGRAFAVKTGLAILGLSLVLATITFPNVTNDNLLVAVFGGFFLGAGIGSAIRGGAVIDGTEVLAIFLGRKFGVSIGDVIIVINVIIFSAAAYFLTIEIALYSMITYIAASKTLDFLVEGIEEYIGVTIVAVHSEEIRRMIVEKMGRGVTIYNGKKGFGKTGEVAQADIVYTVITRLEIGKLNAEIEKIEPTAFVVMNSVKEARGGMIKRRPLDH
jgi:uncharacterized membrane-anchored protein YitT (DUF2179 family)